MVAPIKSGEAEVLDVDLGDIDTAPAAAVREGLNAEALDDYAAADLDGVEFPPIEVFRYWGGGRHKYLAADGRHRHEARKRNGRATIRCRVHLCGKSETRAVAERLAYAAAAGANAVHGLRRSREDKRAAVAAVIGRPEYADKEAGSDRAIAELCKVSKSTVRFVRDELSDAGVLTGEASSAERYEVVEGARIGSGRVSDGKGGTIPDRRLAKADLGGGRLATPDPDPPAGQAAPTMADELGRPVPDALVPVFRERKRFRQFSQNVSALLAELEEWHREPSGAALTMNPLRVDGENLSKGVAGAMPYCVCPDYTEAAPCGAICKHCAGRGWLSRLRFKQLPTAKARFAESFGAKNGEAA